MFFLSLLLFSLNAHAGPPLEVSAFSKPMLWSAEVYSEVLVKLFLLEPDECKLKIVFDAIKNASSQKRLNWNFFKQVKEGDLLEEDPEIEKLKELFLASNSEQERQMRGAKYRKAVKDKEKVVTEFQFIQELKFELKTFLADAFQFSLEAENASLSENLWPAGIQLNQEAQFLKGMGAYLHKSHTVAGNLENHLFDDLEVLEHEKKHGTDFADLYLTESLPTNSAMFHSKYSQNSHENSNLLDGYYHEMSFNEFDARLAQIQISVRRLENLMGLSSVVESNVLIRAITFEVDSIKRTLERATTFSKKAMVDLESALKIIKNPSITKIFLRERRIIPKNLETYFTNRGLDHQKVLSAVVIEFEPHQRNKNQLVEFSYFIPGDFSSMNGDLMRKMSQSISTQLTYLDAITFKIDTLIDRIRTLQKQSLFEAGPKIKMNQILTELKNVEKIREQSELIKSLCSCNKMLDGACQLPKLLPQ